ncbi:hypothetical protein HPB51_023845 [Rhipicephalus microplus]|uniref:Uncharacterized protein n=1 Tax=Rhipicephalus microplus TaxID=6941 RepID=A0A9J6F9I0_RHIMP|nr:hypothetical protein HPB51_023845 [Rhipicephalus microplus]
MRLPGLLSNPRPWGHRPSAVATVNTEGAFLLRGLRCRSEERGLWSEEELTMTEPCNDRTQLRSPQPLTWNTAGILTSKHVVSPDSIVVSNRFDRSSGNVCPDDNTEKRREQHDSDAGCKMPRECDRDISGTSHLLCDSHFAACCLRCLEDAFDNWPLVFDARPRFPEPSATTVAEVKDSLFACCCSPPPLAYSVTVMRNRSDCERREVGLLIGALALREPCDALVRAAFILPYIIIL